MKEIIIMTKVANSGCEANFPRNEQKILKTTSIIPVISIIIFSIISISGFYYTTSQNNKTELLQIKQSYVNSQKELLKNEIDTVYNYIQYKINKLSHKVSQKEL